jgi:hypothetical protein
MWYHVLACDYDGTLASEGRIAPETVRALGRVRESGRRLVLITGRQFEDLLGICPEIDLFDWVVVENGAVLYEPRGKRVDDLAAPAPAAFLAALERAGVPFSTGRIVVSAVVPHETAVLRVIHDLGLALQIILNRESVMVLPAGVSKQSGLEEALRRLGVPADKVIGVGDAENDLAFLRLAGFAVAVGNAVPSLAAEADLVTRAPNGAGVREFVEEWLLAGREPFRRRAAGARPPADSGGDEG